MYAKQGPNAVRIFSVKVESFFADDLVIDTGLLHFKAGCINQHIKFVLHTVEHRSIFVDLSYALAFGVDECDVGPIEGR